MCAPLAIDVKYTCLEPVDGTAVDERREHTYSVPECISDGTHGQHHVQLLSYSVHKEIEEGKRCAVCLLRLLSLSVGGDKITSHTLSL